MIPDTPIRGLKQMALSVLGDWKSTSAGDWTGAISCDEPVVGVAMLEVGTKVEWVLSERDAKEVRLWLVPYDGTGIDVQVGFSVGKGSRRWRTMLPSPFYRPEIIAPWLAETGRVIEFCQIPGSPVIWLKALFLAKSDVQVGRNGVWHLRRELAGSLSSPFEKMLTWGRTGVIPG